VTIDKDLCSRGATLDRVGFLTEQLALNAIDENKIASIPELKQPSPANEK